MTVDKLKMHSLDLTRRNIDAIAERFPTVVTESLDGDGNSVRAIDFDALRQELSDHIVEGPQERYQLDWPGKRAAAFAANAPIAKTLRPVREESVDFDTTRNLFIEGDNLDALKLLQESYLGKVKLIYIDPPYNTGKDFVFNDNYGTDAAEFLRQSMQAGIDGERLVANPDTAGRFHSDWLSMIYPRLGLARNLLATDGVFMASINDWEAPRLRQLLDEVFGQGNFLGQMIWEKGREGGNDNEGFGQHHEYVLVYARNASQAAAAIKLDEKDTSRHRAELPEPNRVIEPAEIYRDGEPFQLINLSKQKDYTVEIPLNDGSIVTWPSYAPQSTINSYLDQGRIFVGDRGVPYIKSFLADEASGTKPSTLLGSEWGTTKAGGIAIRDLFGDGKVFSYPKPPKLIRRLIEIAGADGESVILDFFAGSSTTAQAVLEANAADGGRRQFIMVQFPEDLNDQLARVTGAARKSVEAAIAVTDELRRPPTLCEVSKERIRRSAKSVRAAAEFQSESFDLGFRAFVVDTTNMAETTAAADALGQRELKGMIDSVKPDRTDEDLLFQVLLDWGLDLSLPITRVFEREREREREREIFRVADDALIACFSEEVSADVVAAIAKSQPLRAVFRDSAFKSDADRINAEQIFREVSPNTEVKTL